MASSFARRETALLLQAAYSGDQIRAFENFDQLLEDALIVLRPGPKEFFQDELRFVDRLKSQLLIGHLCLPICILSRPAGGTRNQAAFGRRPRISDRFDQFLFQQEET